MECFKTSSMLLHAYDQVCMCVCVSVHVCVVFFIY